MIRSTLLLLFAVPLAAQTSPPRTGCPDSTARQFDFWVGEWNVTTQGQTAGTSSVTLEEDGCVIHEHWTGAKGGTGQSFNFVDRYSGEWTQWWVDNSGGNLRLTGKFSGNQMRLTGTRPGPDGKPQAQRLTFTRNPDGTVRQVWDASSDGKTWTVVFDGLYRKKG